MLYAVDQPELAEAIIRSLSQSIFHGNDAQPASKRKVFLGRIAHRVVSWTTRTAAVRNADGSEGTRFKNRLIERSGHPYAHALLTSSHRDSAALVEGGDPMNGPYMMLSPELRKNGNAWDRIFLDSVQGRDVQFRFIHETLATYQAAKRVLDRGEAVRIKAVAAGTGLSLILVYDKLIRDGYDPDIITAVITDRDPANTEKTNRLLTKLSTTRPTQNLPGHTHGIFAVAEDVFEGPDPLLNALHVPYDVVTAIGILEYFQGDSHGTTEQRLLLHEPEEPVTAKDLLVRLEAMTRHGGNLVINTYRDHPAIRILEHFGKRFDFRERRHLHELLAPLNFRSFHLAGSGHIYDIEVFEKALPDA